MLKLVKNIGQCKALKGKCKYLFCICDKDLGYLYAKPGIKPIIGYVLAMFRSDFNLQ